MINCFKSSNNVDQDTEVTHYMCVSKEVLRTSRLYFHSLSRMGMHFITKIWGKDSNTHVQKGVYAFLGKSVQFVK